MSTVNPSFVQMYYQLENMAVFLRHGVFKIEKLVSSKNVNINQFTHNLLSSHMLWSSHFNLNTRHYSVLAIHALFTFPKFYHNFNTLSFILGSVEVVRHKSWKEEGYRQKSRAKNRFQSPVFSGQRVCTLVR